MYNEELETLIDAALADGELTEKEKQVLFKRAQAEGIDLDEFEMILDARLTKLKKANQPKTETAAPKSNKFGDVKKCPSCGAIVQSYQGACPECGYAFEGLTANSSAQKLAEKIDEIMKEASETSDKAMASSNSKGLFGMGKDVMSGTMRVQQAEESAQKRIQEVIKNFPIPNTKSDLMEFIITMKLKSQSGQNASAYFAKYAECIEKAKFLFPNDKDFAPMVASFSKRGGFKRWWSALPKKTRVLLIYVVGSVVILILMSIFMSSII